MSTQMSDNKADMFKWSVANPNDMAANVTPMTTTTKNTTRRSTHKDKKLSIKVEPKAASTTHSRRKRTGRGKADEELSPRSLAQREKNREAVRKCRKRKKAHTMELRERAVQLEEENAKLRMQLQLGSEDVRREKTEQGEKLVQEMAKLVKTPGQDADAQLRRCVTLYVERHQDYGRDRQAAIGYILSRLKRLVQPSISTKMYLWQMSQEEDTYFEDPKGIWKDMCRELSLTEEQENRLKRRRTHARLLRAEFAYAESKMQHTRHLMARNKKVGDAFTELTSILTPRQFAKFVLFVHNDPGCKDILDRLWDSVLQACDDIIETELVEKKDESNKHVMKLLKRAREDCAALTKDMFEAKDSVEMKKLIRVCFDDEIVIIDPNNGGELSGLEGVERYVRRIQRAFQDETGKSSLHAQQKELYVDELGKGHSSWTLTGTYHGKLRLDPNQKRSRSTEVATNLRKVSFDVLIKFTFPPGSEKVNEMIISWDAMSLMTQLGMMNFNQLDATLDALENASPKTHDDDPIISADVEKRACEKLCQKLVTLFEMDSAECSSFAENVLDPTCTFVDAHIGGEYKGVEECKHYLERIKSAFPEWKIESTIVESNSLGEEANKSSEFLGTGNAIVDDDSTGGEDNSISGKQFHLKWRIRGKYGGSLVDTKHECVLTADVFVIVCSKSLKVLSAQFNFNAADLMHQLGIIMDTEE